MIRSTADRNNSITGISPHNAGADRRAKRVRSSGWLGVCLQHPHPHHEKHDRQERIEGPHGDRARCSKNVQRRDCYASTRSDVEHVLHRGRAKVKLTDEVVVDGPEPALKRELVGVEQEEEDDRHRRDPHILGLALVGDDDNDRRHQRDAPCLAA